MAQRSRKRGRREREVAAAAPTPARPYARSEARNEAVRSNLTPYAEGERPWAIKLSATLAAGFGAVNLVSWLVGAKPSVDGRQPGVAAVLLFALVMFTCAGGMWRMLYWAVVAFEALLLLALLAFAILLIKVSNLAGLAVCLVGLTVGGVLFYKLIRVMSRLQVPLEEKG